MHETLRETAGSGGTDDFLELVVTNLIVTMDREGFTTEEIRVFLDHLKGVESLDNGMSEKSRESR